MREALVYKSSGEDAGKLVFKTRLDDEDGGMLVYKVKTLEITLVPERWTCETYGVVHRIQTKSTYSFIRGSGVVGRYSRRVDEQFVRETVALRKIEPNSVLEIVMVANEGCSSDEDPSMSCDILLRQKTGDVDIAKGVVIPRGDMPTYSGKKSYELVVTLEFDGDCVVTGHSHVVRERQS